MLRPFSGAESSPKVLRYWDTPPRTEPAQAERFIAACGQFEQEGFEMRLAITHASEGALIGWCTLFNRSSTHRGAKLRYCFDDAAWGHGFATEAAGVLLRWAFETLDLNRVQAERDTRNAASSRVLEKPWFVRDGKLREDCIVDGEVSDSFVYGLLRRDWQVARVGPAAG